MAQHVGQAQRIDARRVQAHAVPHAPHVADQGRQPGFAQGLSAREHHGVQQAGAGFKEGPRFTPVVPGGAGLQFGVVAIVATPGAARNEDDGGQLPRPIHC
ncbi:hypothetical protein D3C71_1622230 [compost metagenome]